MNIRLMGAELFHADGHTMTNVIGAFRNYANTPKKEHSMCRSRPFVHLWQ